METIRLFRRCAAEGLQMALETNCSIDRARPALIAQGWQEIAAALSVLFGTAIEVDSAPIKHLD